MRIPAPLAAAGGLLVVLGGAGLLRGATEPVAAQPGSAAPIVVSAAYVRPPVPPTQAAAAYFTATNTTDRADQLTAVRASVSGLAVVHLTVGGVMTAGSVITIPAHGRLTLAAGAGHVMLEQLTQPLLPGGRVALQLTFRNAGQLTVSAPVVPFGTAPPTGAADLATGPPRPTAAAPGATP